MTQPLLEVSGLTVDVGADRALDGVSLRVGSQRAIGVVAPPRSGKSFLIAAILGQIPVTAGTVRVCGFDVRTQTRAARSCTTWVAGTGSLQQHLTVWRNVTFLLQLAGHRPSSSADLENALRRSEIPDRKFFQLAASLSPREVLCVWLAVARLRDTPVVVLDEPTERLTSNERRRVAALVRDLASEERAVVVATRDPTFAELLADEIWLLERGRLLPIDKRLGL